MTIGCDSSVALRWVLPEAYSDKAIRVPLLDRAYEIASAERIGIYDCIHVALAESQNCELVTADDKLIKNLQSKFRFVRHLSTFP